MSKQAISTEQVKKLKEQYATNKNSILIDSLQLTDTLPTFEIFERAAFEQLLALNGCVGIRMYYGMDEDKKVNLIAIAVDKNGEDIVSTADSPNEKNTDDSIIAFSASNRCPPDCFPPPPPPPPPDEP